MLPLPISQPDKLMRRLAIWGLFALALFFATYELTESPGVWYDEGWYFQSAANLAVHSVYGLQFAPGIISSVSKFQSVSYPLTHVLAAWFKVFGVSILSGRALMVVFIMALLAAAYALSRRLFGWKAALGALALLTTFAPLYGNGKSILGETPGLFYLLVSLLLLNLAISPPSDQSPKKKIILLVAAALSAGLCMATKPFFLLLAPGLITGAFIAWRRKSLSGKEIAIVGIAMAIPLMIWIFVQMAPGESLTNVLAFYANPYAYGNPSDGHSMFSVVFASIKSLFTSLSTLYTVLLMGIWAASLAIKRFSKARAAISIEESIAFAFSVLVFLAFLRIGAIFRYFYAAQIMTLIFLPQALRVVTGAVLGIWRTIPLREPIRKLLPILAVLALSAFGAYQVMFSSWVAEAYGSHKTAFWQGYFDSVGASTTVFFYETPEVVPFMHGQNYYQLLLADRLEPLGKEGLSAITQGTVDEIVIETSKYEPLKDGLFKAYEVDETPYKYSILKRK